MNREENKKDQDRRAAAWESPASILCRWRNDPNPCGTLENSNQENREIVKISKVKDVDAYMDIRFGCDAKSNDGM